MLLAGRRSRAGSRPPSPSKAVPISSAARLVAGTPVPPAGGSEAGDDDDDSAADARGWHSPACSMANSSESVYERSIEVLTSVFRAGLAGAETDHTRCAHPAGAGAWHASGADRRWQQPHAARVARGHARALRARPPPSDTRSICFPVDDAGELGRGVTATHWYKLGAGAAGRIPSSANASWDEHPQSGYLIAGGRRCGQGGLSLIHI